jgi:NAD(P)-dependent dehydrogenase (short-subunit alcohol dehydrogenase family)
MSERLAGRVAIVTGAAQGIGAAITRRFVGEGAAVVGIDIKAAELQALHEMLERFTAFPADVCDHQALATCVAETVEAHGRIDILVNNAGTADYTPFVEMTIDRWRATLQTNLEAQFALCRLVAPHMIRRGAGRIVNISSAEAIQVEPNLSSYAASKGGVNAFTRSLAVELAEHGIIVNAIAPGCIHTPLSIVNGVDETTTETFQEWYVRRRKIPLARPGEAHEVAAVALFLASDECTYLTGQTIVVDGGLTVTF